MINILVPLAGKNTFETNSTNVFPKILSDIGGELLIERAAKPFLNLDRDKKIVVAVPKSEVETYKLNNVIPLLSSDVELCIINGNTKGAACSALLAMEQLDLDEPLIISSFEQVLDFDLTQYVDEFISKNYDAGVLTFEAIHPKWSYVKVNAESFVTQAAEKNPISKNAIAGMYFFKSARIFLEAAKNMIRKDVKTNGLFYISPTINEIILNEGVVKAILIDKANYFHINDEHALVSYEDKVTSEKDNIVGSLLRKTEQYVEAFHNKRLASVKSFFSPDFCLTDPSVTLQGRDAVVDYIARIFDDAKSFSFKAKNISASKSGQSVIEFELEVNGKYLKGADIICWNDNLDMVSMNAYLYETENEQK